jgi:hypothetical protein
MTSSPKFAPAPGPSGTTNNEIFSSSFDESTLVASIRIKSLPCDGSLPSNFLVAPRIIFFKAEERRREEVEEDEEEKKNTNNRNKNKDKKYEIFFLSLFTKRCFKRRKK